MRKLKPTEVASVLQQIVVRQDGKCDICGHPFTVRDKACLDHDHATGRIRGALHLSCNGVEGVLRKASQRSHKGISADEYLIGLGQYLAQRKKYALIHPSHKTEEEKRVKRNTRARTIRANKKAQSKRSA